MPPPNNATTSEVLKIYTLAAKTSLTEHQEAFDGAVGAYRARNQDMSEKVARRAVERIICNNLSRIPRCSDGDHGPVDLGEITGWRSQIGLLF